MNVWNMRSPRAWWRGHHWKYTYQPYAYTCDRMCQRCGRFQKMILDDDDEDDRDLWVWYTLRIGNLKCTGNR